MEQIGPKVKTVVFVDLDTKRVLGFAPEGLKPVVPCGTRYETKTPFDTMELEKWVNRYREEQKSDLEEKTYRQFSREAPVRKAMRDALLSRNNHVSPANRALNIALADLMDSRYKKTMDAKMKAETFLVAEAYDESKYGEDIACESPFFKGKVN